MLLLSGKDLAEDWKIKPKNASFFDLKGMAAIVLEKMGVSGLQEKVEASNCFNEALLFSRGDKEFLQMGQVKADILAHFEIDQAVFVAILDWDALLKSAGKNSPKFQNLPRHPWVRRDLALIVDKSAQYESLKITAKKAGGKLLREVNLFDVFEGKNIPEGKKSYAMSFILQDAEETLTDKRVEDVMEKIMSQLKKQQNAELR